MTHSFHTRRASDLQSGWKLENKPTKPVANVPTVAATIVDVCTIVHLDLCIPKIGRAHVCTPVTHAHLVCRLLHEKQNSREPLCTPVSNQQIQFRLNIYHQHIQH